MKIIKFNLFENTANNTQGNTKGMGNVKSPQPSKEPGKVSELPSETRIPEPIEKVAVKEEPTNEKKSNDELIKFFDWTEESVTGKLDLDELLTEIKNMTEEEVDDMLNENKFSLEKIGYQLIEQKKNIQTLSNNINNLDDRLSSIENGMIKIISLNNLKTK